MQPTKLKNAASAIATRDKGNGIIVSLSWHKVSKQMSLLMFLSTNKKPAINDEEAYSTPNMITYSCAFSWQHYSFLFRRRHHFHWHCFKWNRVHQLQCYCSSMLQKRKCVILRNRNKKNGIYKLKTFLFAKRTKCHPLRHNFFFHTSSHSITIPNDQYRF